MNDDNRPEEYRLVMPFVVCRSQGGPWDDEAFVAGYEMGRIDQDPGLVGSTGCYIHADSVPQADLIAMRHGLTCETADTDESGVWTLVRFHAAIEGGDQ
jgi:hypothetical protein